MWQRRWATQTRRRVHLRRIVSHPRWPLKLLSALLALSRSAGQDWEAAIFEFALVPQQTHTALPCRRIRLPANRGREARFQESARRVTLGVSHNRRCVARRDMAGRLAGRKGRLHEDTGEHNGSRSYLGACLADWGLRKTAAALSTTRRLL